MEGVHACIIRCSGVIFQIGYSGSRTCDIISYANIVHFQSAGTVDTDALYMQVLALMHKFLQSKRHMCQKEDASQGFMCRAISSSVTQVHGMQQLITLRPGDFALF